MCVGFTEGVRAHLINLHTRRTVRDLTTSRPPMWFMTWPFTAYTAEVPIVSGELVETAEQLRLVVIAPLVTVTTPFESIRFCVNKYIARRMHLKNTNA